MPFAFFRLYSRYFAFDFRVFSPLIALFRLYLRYYAFIGVITPLNSALLRIHSRYNAFHFGVITHLFAF